MMRVFVFLLFLFISTSFGYGQAKVVEPGWPEIRRETKPWTRWWWQGSAVTKEGLTAELESFSKAGLGGVEITPIYGVWAHEKEFVDYLSPEWMKLFLHVLKECERLNLGVDMATGTGWPFGGPWVRAEDACKNLQHKVYELKGGSSLKEKIEFVQQPYIRAIGNLIYEVNAKDNLRLKDGLTEFNGKAIDIKNIKEPVETNENLQSYAFDQVQFQKSLQLQVLIAYSVNGKVIDLTSKVDRYGYLKWQAPGGDWKLYAIFEGWHGKMVERAAPGGEGNVIDHFSSRALQHYLAYFDKAFKNYNITTLRAFFNDSYEVDDAKGSADWTPTLFEEFIKRRGYDLRQHLPALFSNDTDEKNKRILSDYRQTIGEMLRDNFTKQWKAWAAKHSAIIRNQAHGSPANILDLYGIVDIPEIEGTEPLRMKMASSAGNVLGKQLVSSESATWLNEHFESALHDVKDAVDLFMLQGVNHIFYHGTAYSPHGEPWPGWLFYAAVHLNSRNPQWKDFGTLNAYIARCQSFLQNTKSDNEVLLYYPIYDRFAVRGTKMLEHFDGIGKQFEGSSFEETAEALYKQGVGFDYISDLQIANSSALNGLITTEGKSKFKVLVIPQCEFMPVSTLEKLRDLINAGIKVIFINDLPKSFSGYERYDSSAKAFQQLTSDIKNSVKEKTAGVRIVNTDLLEEALGVSGIQRETVGDQQLSCIRKVQHDGTKVYFINNPNSKSFNGWVTLQTGGKIVVIYNSLTGEYGKAKIRNVNDKQCDVYLQLESKQSLILQFYDRAVAAGDYFYLESGEPITLQGTWHLKFISGGPVIPPSVTQEGVQPWTMLKGDAYQDFSGTCSYQVSFPKPQINAIKYLLDLGTVKESASVFLNGSYLRTLIGPEYKVLIDACLLKDNNVLEVQVSNLMANRIAYMDRNNIFWKKFYNVNFPSRKPENSLNNLFDASQWKVYPSGLIGPVQIYPVKEKAVY